MNSTPSSPTRKRLRIRIAVTLALIAVVIVIAAYSSGPIRLDNNAQTQSGETPAVDLAFSPDASLLAVGRGTGVVEVWRVQDHKLIHRFDQQAAVSGVAFTQDGSTLISADPSGTIYWWNVESGEIIRTHTVDVAIHASVLMSDGSTLILAEYGIPDVPDGMLRWLDTKSGDIMQEVAVQFPNGLDNLVLSPDGSQVAAGGWGRIQIWDAQTGASIQFINTGYGDSMFVAWVDDATLASASREHTGSIDLWSATTGALVDSMYEHHSASLFWREAPRYTYLDDYDIYGFTLNPAARRLAMGYVDGTVRVWQANWVRASSASRADSQ